MKKISKWIVSYESSDLFLSVFRFLFFLGLMWPIYKSQLPQGLFQPFGLYELLGLKITTTGQFACLKAFLLISLFLSAIGLFARVFIFLAFISLFLFVGTIYSHLYSPINNYTPSDYNLTLLVCFILLFSPNIGKISIFNFFKKDPDFLKAEEKVLTNSWPRYLIVTLLGLVYFISFISKVKSGVWGLSGDNLRYYMAEFGLFRQSENLLWLSNQKVLMTVMSIGLLLFEALAIIGFYLKGWRWAFIVFGLVFHVLTYELFSIDYISKYVWIYLVFIDWDLVFKKIAAQTGPK